MSDYGAISVNETSPLTNMAIPMPWRSIPGPATISCDLTAIPQFRFLSRPDRLGLFEFVSSFDIRIPGLSLPQ